jgi:hypothetical protein
MRLEVADHMRRGAEQTELFLRTQSDVSGKSKRGDMT